MPLPGGSGKLRAASKNERRVIIRHALGFYRALAMTGLYTVVVHRGDGNNTFDITKASFYMPALKRCIAIHPILSAAIRGQDSEAPEFIRPASLDLRNHVQIIDPISPDYASIGDELDLLKRVTLNTHDQMFPDIERIPPWKIVILPLHDEVNSMKKRVYVIFAFSHSHGDGKSGLAFHRTFLEGLQAAHLEHDQSPVCAPPSSPLPPPLEEACTLRISWSFLLLTLFGAYLPNFVRQWLGLPAQSTHPWTGKPISYDPDNFHTGSEILVIDKNLLSGILAACRARGAKLTGLLNQLVVRAVSAALPADNTSDSFIGQIVVDLRALVPAYSDNEMVNCVTVVNETNSRFGKISDKDRDNTPKHDKEAWDAARQTTMRLADSASTLVDQPIGLLQYLNSFRAWYVNKLGGNRDSSYEISNLVSFDSSSSSGSESNTVPKTSQQDRNFWDIERIVFSQPANATSCPLNFQVVTRKGGDMVITLNWQLGVLDVVDENAFAADILGRIYDLLAAIATGA